MTHLFEHELEGLREILLTMGSQAESAVSRAVKAFVTRDDELARQVEADDSLLDQLEIEVDDLSISLLAQAPLATHLRLTTIAMKVSQNLERVGDEATKIARRTLDLNTEPPLKELPDIPAMGALATSMLKGALDAFVTGDIALARATIQRDTAMDASNKQIQRDLVQCMLLDSGAITRCLHVMVIAKSLERIADHATNVAEEIIFLTEGRDVRHAGIKGAASPPTTQTNSHET